MREKLTKKDLLTNPNTITDVRVYGALELKIIEGRGPLAELNLLVQLFEKVDEERRNAFPPVH